MYNNLTIKQLLRKKYFNIKKDLLLKNQNVTNNYHWGLRQNAQKIVGRLIQNQQIMVKNKQLLVGTYLPIQQRQIIPPCFSVSFEEKFGIKVRYFTPYFTSQNRKMHFVNYHIQQKKMNQFCLGPFGVKIPKFLPQPNIIDPESLHILLVPLICIQRNSLQRIGYGGGYYDQYIRQNKPRNTISIGVALEDLVLNQNQLDENKKDQCIWNSWDQPLEYAITEKTILKAKQQNLL